MKNQYVFAALAASIALVAGVMYLGYGLKIPAPELLSVQIHEQTVRVYVADTEEERQKGLGGFAGLESGQGMLFVFPADGEYGFWMKDMRFAIDIIWIAADKTVVDMAENVSPDTYPNVFSPSEPARFVLELPAGAAKTYKIRVGDEVGL